MDIQTENLSSNNFEQCTKCTSCTTVCPVTQINPFYPGPKQAGPDGERYRLKNQEFFDEALKYCLNCKRCEVACPSGVRIGDIILNARRKNAKGHPALRDTMLAQTDIVGTLATTVAPLVNTSLALKPVKLVMDRTLGIDAHRTFPAYASTRFVTWFRRNASAKQAKFSRHVSYFHGCYVNYNYPALGKALVGLYNALGFGVTLLEHERCCGVAKIANMLFSQATRDAAINLDAMRYALAKGSEAIVATSSTCCFTMRDEYPHVLGLDNADVRPRLLPAVAHIWRMAERGEVKLVFRQDYRKRVAYHTPCHMERMGFTHYSLAMLGAIPGVELVELDVNCCGIAGTYGFKKENYPTSQAIGAPLFEQIKTVDPDVVATDCETCKWQIEMSTGVRVQNPVEILFEALDVDATLKANNTIR